MGLHCKGEDRNQERGWKGSSGGPPSNPRGLVWALLALSLCANVWLARALLRPPSDVVKTDGIAGNVPASVDEPSAPPQAQAPDEFRWSMVQSSDYRRYLGNLRVIGCPAETATNLIARLIIDEFQEARWELARPLRENFWKFAKNPDDPQAILVKDSISKLEAETAAVLERLFPGQSEEDFLLGGRSYDDGKELSDLDAAADLDFLSAEKQKAVRLIVSEVEKPLDNVRALTFRPFPENMLEVLTPEEFEEYEVRHGGLAAPSARIRDSLYGFPATPAELRAIAKVMVEAENEQFLGYNAAKYEAVEDERLKSFLGAARFAEFKRGLDPGFRNFALLADCYGAPVEAAGEIYELEKRTGATARELLADPKATEGEKRAALADLREGLRRKLRDLFGPSAVETWGLNGGFKLPALEGK